MVFDGEFIQGFEVENWFVTFHERSDRWWVNKFALGRYKHVSAFGYVVAAKAWVFVDVLGHRMRIRVAADDKANALIGAETLAGVVVRMPDAKKIDERLRFKPGGWCVPVTAHLVGLGGCALLPDGLLRQCLANGGQIVSDNAHEIRN